METIKHKYISFIKVRETEKTQVWKCINNKSQTELGEIKWYPGWRRYCFLNSVLAVWSSDCMDIISEFVSKLNNDHKTKNLNDRDNRDYYQHPEDHKYIR